MHLTVSNMLDEQVIYLLLQGLFTSTENRNFDMQCPNETLEKISGTSYMVYKLVGTCQSHLRGTMSIYSVVKLVLIS